MEINAASLKGVSNPIIKTALRLSSPKSPWNAFWLWELKRDSTLEKGVFTIYQNYDLINVSDLLQYIIFADDTNIFYSHDDYNSLITHLDIELPKLSLWFRSNMLSLNVSKINFIHFTSCKKNEIAPGNIHLFIDDVAIEQKTHTKFLGVVINENLNWSDHVKYISTPIAVLVFCVNYVIFFL